MSFVRLRKAKGKYYASKVESYRNEEGKVRQKTLASYGRVRRGLLRRLFNRRPSKAEVERVVKG